MTAVRTSVGRATFLAGAAASLGAMPLRTRAADLTEVSAGTIASDVSAVLVYALDRGTFKGAGLDIKLTTLRSGPVVANAVAGGSLDIGAANVGSLCVARSRGIPLKMFAPAGIADAAATGDIIAVLKDSPIKTAADLNGKTVGIVALKTMQHAAVLAWIDKHGGDSKSVKFVEVPFPEMGGSMEAHRVDATIPTEPYTTSLRPIVRSLGDQWDAMKMPFPIFAFFATETWLATHADTAVTFASVIRQTAFWANAHRKETALMLAKFAKLDPELAKTMGRSTYGTTLDAAMIQPIIDIQVKYGMMAKPIDPAEMIWKAPHA
ncbi:MAG TPA: ABC transporter substrate-binding protein [Candidatus Aquilonibacter sp.]